MKTPPRTTVYNFRVTTEMRAIIKDLAEAASRKAGIQLSEPYVIRDLIVRAAAEHNIAAAKKVAAENRAILMIGR